MSDGLRPDLSPDVRRAIEELLAEGAPPPSKPERSIVLLRITEAAALLGLDRKDLFRLAKAGKIRWYQVAGSMRFDLDDVRAFDIATPIPPKRTRQLTRDGIQTRVRFRVLERDNFRCVYCGATAEQARLVIDHVVSVADGGSNDESNLVAACEECNAGKGRRSVER